LASSDGGFDQEIALNIVPRVFALGAALIAFTASSPADADGNNEALLIKALLENASGNCPELLMSVTLKAACDEDLPFFVHTLARLGAIKSTRFEGMKTLNSGPAEVYTVGFEHGEMTFVINTQSDGKILNLFTVN
jgi:hypothetical protein